MREFATECVFPSLFLQIFSIVSARKIDTVFRVELRARLIMKRPVDTPIHIRLSVTENERKNKKENIIILVAPFPRKGFKRNSTESIFVRVKKKNVKNQPTKKGTEVKRVWRLSLVRECNGIATTCAPSLRFVLLPLPPPPPSSSSLLGMQKRQCCCSWRTKQAVAQWHLLFVCFAIGWIFPDTLLLGLV